MNPLSQNEPIQSGPDLNDPAQLAAVLRNDAQGLEAQAIAANPRGSAMAGHPFPDQFYTQTAAHLRLAAERIEAATAKPAPVTTPTAPPPAAPPKPAPKG